MSEITLQCVASHTAAASTYPLITARWRIAWRVFNAADLRKMDGDGCAGLRDCAQKRFVCMFVPGEGRAAYCCSDSGAFPFWEPPSTHLFFSSLASMPPDCHLVKGFSRSIPPESCCQTCFIIVSPELLQANGFLYKLERENFS